MLSTTGIPRTNPAQFTWHEEPCIAHAQGWQASTTWVMEKSCASEVFTDRASTKWFGVFVSQSLLAIFAQEMGVVHCHSVKPFHFVRRKNQFCRRRGRVLYKQGAVGRFNKYFVGSRWACKGLRRLTSSTNFRKRQGLAGCQSAVV